MNYNLTVGKLLEFIQKNNIPPDAEILYQRIEDQYFEHHGWKAHKKEGEWYHRCKTFNEQVESGYFDDKEQFPLIDEPFEKYSEEDLENEKEQYVQAFAALKFPEDNNLYITAHH